MLALLIALGAAAQEPPGKAFAAKHCADCHDADEKKGGLDLGALAWKPDDRAAYDRWVRVFDKVARGEMPPAKKARPDAAELKGFLDALGGALREAGAARQKAEGRTVLRRLNRGEVERSLHDLLGIDLPLKHLLPEDTPAHGFDTVAEGLRFSTLQMEKVLEVADAAIDAALVLGPEPKVEKKRCSWKDERGIRENLDTPDGGPKKHRQIFRELPDAVVFFSDGYSPTDLRQFSARTPGRYRIRVSAQAYQSGGRPVGMRVYAHRFTSPRLLGAFDAPADAPREVEFVARLGANEILKVVPYDTNVDAQGKGVFEVGAPAYSGSGLAVRWIEVEGPLFESWPPPSVFGPTRPRARRGFELVPGDPRPVVERFAARAFRRPLEAGEADAFLAPAKGLPYEEGLRVAFRAILTAPQFLYLEEKPGPLSGPALASRLSYFLRGAPPDAELLAGTGDLRGQAERLLKDPRVFVREFAGQWLDLRKIDATTPDKRLYPEFDEMLQLSMVGESEAFFAELLEKDLPVANFIDSDFLMLNRRIAEHYGIPGVLGEEFRRVPRPEGSPRGGLLGQAAVLKVTANGTVTSPVMRGAWVLQRLLGRPPAPPPADAGTIEPDTRGATTVREQLAKHRNTPACAACHRAIDPPGFALEAFDVIGGFRERYRSLEKGAPPALKFRNRNIWEYKIGPPVDASGETADGRRFSGIAEFKALLLAERGQVLRALAANLVTYATGAPVGFADRGALEEIVRRTSAAGGGLRTLVHEVIASPLFRNK
jgi:hypothetical protein